MRARTEGLDDKVSQVPKRIYQAVSQTRAALPSMTMKKHLLPLEALTPQTHQPNLSIGWQTSQKGV
jgi:hypothetical protein